MSERPDITDREAWIRWVIEETYQLTPEELKTVMSLPAPRTMTFTLTDADGKFTPDPEDML